MTVGSTIANVAKKFAVKKGAKKVVGAKMDFAKKARPAKRTLRTY